MGIEQIKIELDDILEQYFVEDGEYYIGERTTEDGSYTSLKEEISEFLDQHQVLYEISEEYGFDSPGYSNSFLAVAYVDEAELGLFTVIIESM